MVLDWGWKATGFHPVFCSVLRTGRLGWRIFQNEKSATLKRTTVHGRKRTLDFVDFGASERPLSGKADIQELATQKSMWNGRFTLGSGHSANIGQRVR